MEKHSEGRIPGQRWFRKDYGSTSSSGAFGRQSAAALRGAETGLGSGRTLYVNADVNGAVVRRLGVSADDAAAMPDMGRADGLIRARVVNGNGLTPEQVSKSLPLTADQGFFLPTRADPAVDFYAREGDDGLLVLRAGGFTRAELDAGNCEHRVTNVLGVLLPRIVDEPRDLVVLDCPAGTAAFSGGWLGAAADAAVLVTRPHEDFLDAYREVLAFAENEGLEPVTVVTDSHYRDDRDFLRRNGIEPDAVLPRVDALERALSRGAPIPWEALEGHPEFTAGMRELDLKLQDVAADADWQSRQAALLTVQDRNSSYSSSPQLHQGPSEAQAFAARGHRARAELERRNSVILADGSVLEPSRL